MKKVLILAIAFALLGAQGLFADSIKLPEARKRGGMPLFEALSKRSSAQQRSFNSAALTLEELSIVLWATTGKNREPKGWTVPMAMGREPYVLVYVLLESGSYLYSWQNHELKEEGKGKGLLRSAASQSFAQTAPCVLLFVKGKDAGGEGLAEMATGAMSQNAYLASESLGLKARFLGSVNRTAIAQALSVASGDILGAMVIGKQ